MRRTLLLSLLCCTTSLPALAQLKLPQASPGAKVTQTVGLTDITIEYSSPGVKSRKIWGGLVPLDKVWRAGANHATTVTFSQPVTVGETAVPAGTYGLFVMPGATTWTMILNKTPEQWGSYEYKQEADLLRLSVKPTAIAPRERLAFLVSNFTNDAASIDLEWEKVRVSLPVKLKTAEQAAANIKAATDGLGSPMTQAARYYLDAKDYANAQASADKSIAISETWLNVWVKAQALAGLGKYPEATALAEKAQTMGAKVPADFFAADDVKKSLAEWKTKK